MRLYGKDYDKLALRKRIGNLDQVAGVRTFTLTDGNEHPTRAARIHTGSGLEFTVLLDRCLDVASASFQGKAMGWRSTTGDVAPQYYEPEWTRWLRSYFGGLLTTCGLTTVGAARQEDAVEGIGIHGRIGNTPARNIQIRQEWQGEDYVMSVTGTMRETRVFGENLTLTRTVETRLGEERFWIHDMVTNDGFNESPFMLLYHCNIGWPAVDEGSQILTPSRRIAPRDADAADGKLSWNRTEAPTHAYEEKVYYHDITPDEDGFATVAVLNDGFDTGDGFGVYIKYRPDQLPRFAQWKQMGEQDYVVGLEPCNCGVEGRHIDEELGLLNVLAPGDVRKMDLEFGPVTRVEHAEALRAAAESQKASFVESYKQFVKRPQQDNVS